MAYTTPSLYTSQTAPSTTSTHSLASTPPSSLYPTSTSTATQTPPRKNATTKAPPTLQPIPPKFEFPRTHAFPPFYTLQTQSSTLHAQLQKWSSLILAYHSFYKLTKLSISTALNSELFWNKEIDRRLDEKGVREVLEFMRKEGRVEFVNSGKGGRGEGDICWIWWRSVEEWGSVIESWVRIPFSLSLTRGLILNTAKIG